MVMTSPSPRRMPEAPRHYIGRFAPSPTGPLHLGSLVSAVASYLDARAHNGRWLLRIEDLDPPREQAGAADAIIHSLHAHRLIWDGDILWQSQRHAHYRAALDDLLAQGDAFHCSCSRAQLRDFGGIHAGACVAELIPGDTAIRLRVGEQVMHFNDRLLGPQQQDLRRDGDFVLRRRDGYFAYQLAVVVDDADQGITDIVRGSDLLESTGRQRYLQQRLGLPGQRYLHIPVLTDDSGSKLSKQSFAPAIDDRQPERNLRLALNYLKQPVPPEGLSLDDLLGWASRAWNIDHLPRSLSIPA